MSQTSKRKKKKVKRSKADLSLLEHIQMKPKYTKTETVPSADGHAFWKSQPVPKYLTEEDLDTNRGYVEEKVELVRKDPLDLPEGYGWVTYDITHPEELEEVHKFIEEYYIDDPDSDYKFKLNYTPEFLQWAMTPPNYSPTLHLGVKSTAGDLIGFIAGMPCHLRVYGRRLRMVEINFLCVHPKFRKMKLAPLLIQEITRRVNLLGIWQAVYTGTLVLPHKLTTAQYFHRPLSVKKLVDIKFMQQRRSLTLKGQIKLYNLPEETKTPGLRVMRRRDVNACCQLVNKFMEQYHVGMEFTVREFEHNFMPKDNIVYSYVVEDPKTKLITDFISFYCLPSTVNGHQVHTGFKAAYSYYNVAAKTSWGQLMTDSMVLAKGLGFDVFNALDIMENNHFLDQLKFVPGSGILKYHLYNWKCPPTQSEGVGVVLR